MPANELIVSELHLTEHQFVISQGSVFVFDEIDGENKLEAPFVGVTKPGTRRLLFVESPTFWTTFHPNPSGWQTPEEVRTHIIGKNPNPLLQ